MAKAKRISMTAKPRQSDDEEIQASEVKVSELTEMLAASERARDEERAEFERRLAEMEAVAPSSKADPRLPQQYTNAGIVAKQMKDEREGRFEEGPSISIGKEPWEKGFDQKGDELAAGFEPWAAKNPMQDCIDEHTPEGHVGRMLSETSMRKLGPRNWQVAKDENGDKITVGNMFLGTMPKERAQARKIHFEQEGVARLRQVKERFQEANRHARANDLDTPGNELRITRNRIPIARSAVD